MIRFSLRCSQTHEFLAWFQSNDAYNQQKKDKLIFCPVCDSTEVEKILMTPSVSTSHQREQLLVDKTHRTEILKKLRKLSRIIRKNADFVGEHFSEEARKIHFGEVKSRAIYGSSNIQEALSLLEDGINVVPLPSLPEDYN